MVEFFSSYLTVVPCLFARILAVYVMFMRLCLICLNLWLYIELGWSWSVRSDHKEPSIRTSCFSIDFCLCHVHEIVPCLRLNSAVQQQLNLESVKTRALGLFKAISRILEDFDAMGRSNSTPKWQDVLGQFSMVNMELYNIAEDIKKVSRAFVVHPKNVNAENATRQGW